MSLAVTRLRCLLNLRRIKSEVAPNNVSWSFGSDESMSTSFTDIGRIRGLLPFSGVTLIVRCSKSISIHLSNPHASPLRIHVSLSS